MEHVDHGDIADLVERLQGEEGLQFEAKLASGNVPKSFWETASAFANTDGGIVVFGLKEDDDGWIVEGIKNPTRMIQNIHSEMRNPAKISVEVAGKDAIWYEVVGEKQVIVVRIRPALRRNRPVYLDGYRDRAFVRRGEGDSLCKPDELDRFRREASSDNPDEQIFPYLGLEDFDHDAIERYRLLSEEQTPNRPQHRHETPKFLEMIGAWKHDRARQEEGPTLAGILMFGSEAGIRQVRFPHVIDYQKPALVETPRNRWDDRVRWTKNLFGAWEEIFPRLVRGLPTPFRLQGAQRIDQPSGIDTLREAFVNLLIHTDYLEREDALILHRNDGYLFRNPGDSRIPRHDIGAGTRTARRNPALARMFAFVGLADEAGSGFVRVFNEWKELGFADPRVVSDPLRYEFELELRLTSFVLPMDRAWLGSIGDGFSEEEELALVFARHNGLVDNRTLREATGRHHFDTSQMLRSLRDRGFLIIDGVGRGARYTLGPAAQPAAVSGMTQLDLPASSADQAKGSSDSAEDTDRSVEPERWNQLQAMAGSIASGQRSQPEAIRAKIVELCSKTPLSVDDLHRLLNRTPRYMRGLVTELVRSGLLRPTYQTKNDPRQRYETVGDKPVDKPIEVGG